MTSPLNSIPPKPPVSSTTTTTVLNPVAMAEVSMSLTTSVSTSAFFGNDTSLSYQPQRLNLTNHRNVVVASSQTHPQYHQDGTSNEHPDQNSDFNNINNNNHSSFPHHHPSSHLNANNGDQQQEVDSFVSLSSLTETKVQFLDCHPDWQLVKRIGGGGFGEVWIGYRKSDSSQSLCAIKIAKAARGTMKELDHEIELLLLMPSHPHIVQPLHYSYFLGGTQLVMEFCRGGSLADFLDKHGAMSEDRVREYVRQILLGLSFLHRSGVLHRDIKPHNVLLADERGTLVKLVDFGLSSLFEKHETIGIAGSARFMSPEAFVNSSQVTGATDLWSLGCTIVNLLTNEKPWADRFLAASATRSTVAAAATTDGGDEKQTQEQQKQQLQQPQQQQQQQQGVAGFWQMRSLIISLPLDEKERVNHHPTIPDFVSDDCKAFLKQIFNTDPFRRGTAQQLLSHPWILKASMSWNAIHQQQHRHHQHHQQQQQQLDYHSNENSAFGDRNVSHSYVQMHHLPPGIVSSSGLDMSFSSVFEKTTSSQAHNFHGEDLYASNNNNNLQLISSASFSSQCAVASVSLPSDALNTQLLESAVKHVEDKPDDARLWSCVGRLLPSDETVNIHGKSYSRAQCMYRAALIEPDRVLYWNILGRELNHPILYSLGPTTVARREKSPLDGTEIPVDAIACFIKCLEIAPNNSVSWRNLGLALSSPSVNVRIAGKEYNKQQCYLRAVEIDPSQSRSWSNLGNVLKPGDTISIRGQNYTKLECFIRACSLDPASSAWGNLGTLLRNGEFVEVGNQKFSKLECQLRNVIFNPSAPQSWNNLAVSMATLSSANGQQPPSVSVAGKEVTRLDCLSTALLLDPANALRWRALGLAMEKEGVETVKFDLSSRSTGYSVTMKDCLEKAVCLEPSNAIRWTELASVMDDDEVAYIRPVQNQNSSSAVSNNNNNNKNNRNDQNNSPAPASPLGTKSASLTSSSNNNLFDLITQSQPQSPQQQQSTLFTTNISSTSSSSNTLPPPPSPNAASSSSPDVMHQDELFVSGKENDFPPMNKIQCLTRAACLDPTDAATMYQLSTLLSRKNKEKKSAKAALKQLQQLPQQQDQIIDEEESVLINGIHMTASALFVRVIEVCAKYYKRVDEHCQNEVTDHSRLYQCAKGHVLLPHCSKTWRCDYCRGRDDSVGALSCRSCDIDICCKCFEIFLKNGSVVTLMTMMKSEDGHHDHQNGNVNGVPSTEYKDEY